MIFVKTEKYLLLVLILSGISALIFWFFYDPVDDFALSVPGLDTGHPEILQRSILLILAKSLPFTMILNLT